MIYQKIFKKGIVILVLMICFSTLASAQFDIFHKKPKPLIRQIYGTVSLWDGIGVSGSVFTRGNNLFTVRYLHEDRSITGGNFWEISKHTHLDETGIMYGKGIEVWRLFINGSVGAAYVNYSTDLAPNKIATAGFIANAQAIYAIKPWMAVGIELFGDLNLYQSRTGFLIGLHFGKVRG